MSIKLALIGKGISHSLSPSLYREIFSDELSEYQLLDYPHENDIPSLEELFKSFDGLSITTPYKEYFVKQVQILDESVALIGAINCIGKKNSSFVATNTDFLAMRKLLPQMLQDKEQLVILGDGVMARMIKIVCKEKNINFEQWSRKLTPEKFSRMPLGEIADGNILVINCCGREYNFNHQMPSLAHFWDLNYRHEAHQSFFHNNPNYIDGFNLLKSQAIDAAAFWSSLKI